MTVHEQPGTGFGWTATAVLLAFVAIAIAPQQAAAQVISKCMTISTPGLYTMKRDIAARSASDCIVVTAPNVTMNLGGRTITGNGAGIGLHIASTATNFRADGSVKGAIFTNFAIGVQDDADGATVEEVEGDANKDSGILVNGTKRSVFGSNAARNNTNDGIHVRNATYTTIHNFGSFNNGRYGVWIDQSNRTLIDSYNSGGNGLAGVYLGCSPAGPNRTCAAPSSFNVDAHGVTFDNGQFGTAVDQNSDHNVLSAIGATSNGSDDLFDANIGCAGNIWLPANFNVANQSCIQ